MAHVPWSDEELDEAERLALIRAVEESLADPAPHIPQDVIEAGIEALERRIASILPHAARGSFGVLQLV